MRLPIHGLTRVVDDIAKNSKRNTIQTVQIILYLLLHDETGLSDLAEYLDHEDGKRDPTKAKGPLRALEELGYVEVVDAPTRKGLGKDSPKRLVRVTDWGRQRLGLALKASSMPTTKPTKRS